MADILIRGMEMPEIENNHGIKAEIRMLDGKLELGIMTGGYYCSQEWTYYPLVEIPDHGRLIDADALEQDAQSRLQVCNKYDNQFQKPYEVMRAIALAPTVIPAEPPKEET